MRWLRLSKRTQQDYDKCYSWIGDDLDYEAEALTKVDIVNIRNEAAVEKWPRFADMLVSSLSSVFSEAIEAGKVSDNICLGIKSVYKSNPDANREWTEAEQRLVFSQAPRQLLTPMLIARYTGARGTDIHHMLWSVCSKDGIDLTASKNGLSGFIPYVDHEPLKKHLQSLNRTSVFIVTSSENKPYKTEILMQKAVGDFLRQLAKNKRRSAKDSRSTA